MLPGKLKRQRQIDYRAPRALAGLAGLALAGYSIAILLEAGRAPSPATQARKQPTQQPFTFYY